MRWQPRPKSAAILDRSWELVTVTPYKVTARWLFYVLLQEGYYNKKSDYKNKFMKLLSNARHEEYRDWQPDTLEDDRRQAIVRGYGWASVDNWLHDIPDYVPCQLDKWTGEDVYIELWFEANGMKNQFLYYTDHITLRPMGGQPSIPYKFEAAKALEWAARRYNATVVVLYFGDLDTGGEIISDAIERDTHKWCNCDFEFIRCGLTLEQVGKYGVPENPDKPGEYQWEALAGDREHAAGEIIADAIKPYMRQDAFTTKCANIEKSEAAATEQLRQELSELDIG
jgi:hypothetical protein